MYNLASPYFPESDIKAILSEYESILKGEGLFAKGPNVKKFETEFATYSGAAYGIAVNSCSTGLEAILQAANIGQDDEVIVPSQTFVSSVSSVMRVGARPVFAEINMEFVLDPEDIKKRITNRTKAVMYVHFAGYILPEILELHKFLKERNILLIEDYAHAQGANINGIMAGNLGDAGCTSFFATKIMTTGEGGMITTNSESLAKACRSIVHIGLDTDKPGEIFIRIGTNFRMPEFQAILGLYQLKRLEEFVIHRNGIADVYFEELGMLQEKGIIAFQRPKAGIRHSYWRFLISLQDSHMSRIDLQKKMQALGVQIAWPYEPLVHLQPVFSQTFGCGPGDLPVTEELSKKHFCIPMHARINKEDAAQIAKILKSFLHD